ncbi:fluoride efflux transporter CrcB [Saccharococcus caldoxylosilyticus]|jgi:fluoride exporter|uniref:Fluoride-specific ion channel FluC n=1 Tax=Parageobacillus caldoxylosilyticus NBRC 107762 TaxID=1220594 RepID=A0A023DCA2_9BACL|nr:fluoride efflux transporter CrcB [Parageobacillus caldoxylosilyticus]OQP00764.1 camphor resistance protein CrcB [Geobacillus sp. 44B]MBB3851848.1 CrcB protein [Parageobacillus caldoxylosilyticus]QNU38036.1 fluoride efflux transporter CrcB [Geobacillus sp. 44B]QXJ37674.1 Putative fluoride ion transporter CrcB [Parageobacillus caldoxylosilyticus]BDG34860.1 putative fluoride ion transporter CrcB 2 [Parageobacillus caldoxylosilyticus]
MLWNSALVAIGGFFGAIARFGVSNWIKQKYPSSFPIATLLVNLVGSFLLGYMIGKGWNASWNLLFGTGFMGAFTTFSTFKLENVTLYLNKQWKLLILYLLASYMLGILLAFLGMKAAGM